VWAPVGEGNGRYTKIHLPSKGCAPSQWAPNEGSPPSLSLTYLEDAAVWARVGRRGGWIHMNRSDYFKGCAPSLPVGPTGSQSSPGGRRRVGPGGRRGVRPAPHPPRPSPRPSRTATHSAKHQTLSDTRTSNSSSALL
jgi:hypothetical protein